jgi:hypothetical protein
MVVLTVYVFGIRTIGDWMTQRYGVSPVSSKRF